jgi:hypothetical protein
MSRPLRIQYPGAVYHIMNRGRARQPTFVDETDYRAFLKTFAEAHGLWGIEVFAYCVCELRKETSPGSCATSTAPIPSVSRRSDRFLIDDPSSLSLTQQVKLPCSEVQDDPAARSL